MEDCYTFYVLILGMNENTFWNSDINFISKVAANKSAYDAWVANPKER